MLRVRRANVTLKIKDYELKTYLAKGYSVIDENGTVVQEAPPIDLETYKQAYIRQQKTIVELQNEVLLLTKQLKDLKKKNTSNK